MISFSCVYRSSPCLPSNKRYGVTITVMLLSHSWQESLSNLLAFKNVYEYKKIAKFFFIFSSRGHYYLHVHRKWIVDKRIMVIWSLSQYSGADKERGKTVVAISVDDFCQRFLWNCKQSGAFPLLCQPRSIRYISKVKYTGCNWFFCCKITTMTKLYKKLPRV